MSDLKRTPVWEVHKELGARMVPFGGWDMPVQYSEGIIAEHNWTRSEVSLFDCSHMGQFRVSGPNAATDLDNLLPRSSSAQKVGSCRYNFLLNDEGTVIDDVVVYRMGEEEYYIVVNAGTTPGDAAHIQAHLSADTVFVDESAETAKLDIQGPKTRDVLAALGLADVWPKYFYLQSVEIDGVSVLLSRTGYTGEAGVELYIPAGKSIALMKKILAIPGVKPAGLGARDTLRLEMGYPLYGHELNIETTPLEAGFGGMLKLAGRTFIGGEALAKAPKRKMVALRLESRRAAREGANVYLNGEVIGKVSSGAYGPSVGAAIALAFIPADCDASELQLEAGRTTLDAMVTSVPFYANGTARG